MQPVGAQHVLMAVLLADLRQAAVALSHRRLGAGIQQGLALRVRAGTTLVDRRQRRRVVLRCAGDLRGPFGIGFDGEFLAAPCSGGVEFAVGGGHRSGQPARPHLRSPGRIGGVDRTQQSVRGVLRPGDARRHVEEAFGDLGELLVGRDGVADQRAEPQQRSVRSEDRAGGIDPAVIDRDLVPDLGQEVLRRCLLRPVLQGERADVPRVDDRLGTLVDLGVTGAEEQHAVFPRDVRVVSDQRRFRQVVHGAQLPGQDRQHRVAGLLPEPAVMAQVAQPEGEGGPMVADHCCSSPTSASTPSLLRR